MVFVTGAVASGKRTFVRSLGFDDAQMSGELGAAPVLLDLQELLREGAPEGLLEALCAHEVVVCCEVGSGIVPLDAGERAWRERVGRVACEAASRAERVVRLVAGIPADLA